MGREWLASLNVGLGRLGYRPKYGTGMIGVPDCRPIGRLGYRPKYGTGMIGVPECRPRQARLYASIWDGNGWRP